MSSHVLVVDWLSHLMHSSSVVAAASTSGLPWPQPVLAPLKCPAFLSMKGEEDECWLIPVSSPPASSFASFHLRQSFKEDMMSFVIFLCLFWPTQWGSGQPF